MKSRRDRLSARRNAVGLSQVGLADLVGVNRSTVFRWESGDTDPRPWQRPELARALRITVNELDQILSGNAATSRLDVQSIDPAPASSDRQPGTGTAPADQEAGEQMRRRQFIQGLFATTAGAVQAVALPGRSLVNVADSPLGHLGSAVQRLTRLEHRSQYSALTTVLPGVLGEAERLTITTSGADRADALALRSRARMIQAFTLIKHDDPISAAASAAQALSAAQESGDDVLIGAALRCAAEVQLRAGDYELATDLAVEATSHIGRTRARGRAALAIEGAGLLSAAIACARSGNRSDAMALLAAAGNSAEQLGRDMVGTVVFGPTNVAVHQVALEVELGDPISALHHADSFTFPTDRNMNERHARYLLDVARAQAATNDGTGSVATLLEAETISPEEIRTHRYTSAVVQELLRTDPIGRPELTGLATRCGVLAA